MPQGHLAPLAVFVGISGSQQHVPQLSNPGQMSMPVPHAQMNACGVSPGCCSQVSQPFLQLRPGQQAPLYTQLCWAPAWQQQPQFPFQFLQQQPHPQQQQFTHPVYQRLQHSWCQAQHHDLGQMKENIEKFALAPRPD